MIQNPRPSKTFLHNHLNEKLAPITGRIGIDASSANFKNMHMFNTEMYLGLDIDVQALRNGVARVDAKRSAFGILCDLSELNGLDNNIADVVVSTNTLYWLPLKPRIRAIQHLCRLTKPDGLLLVEMSLDDDFDYQMALISDVFEDIETVYYRNWLTWNYEQMLRRNEGKDIHPIAHSKPFFRFAQLLARLENMTCHVRSGKRHAFIVASGKQPGIEEVFDVERLPMIEPSIYSLMNSTC